MSVPAARPAQLSADPGIERARSPLSSLISLEREARAAENVEQLGFIVVNATHRLVEYDRCLLWRFTPAGKVKIQLVSGVSAIDRNSQAVLSLTRLVKALCANDASVKLKAITSADLPPKLRPDWDEWMPPHGLWCPFVHRTGELHSGLLLTRETPFPAQEINLLEPLIEAYAHAWRALEGGKPNTGSRVIQFLRTRAVRLGVLALLAGALALPVRESALAPAEIVPYRPLIVAAPAPGVVKEFHVRPNEAVTTGHTLFTLDDTEIKSRYDIAEKSLEVARADYLRARQKSFSDQKSKSDLELFKARVEEKRLERDYALALLERTKVRAERDGIAVFTDVNDWIGRPVETGERLLTLADPGEVEIQIWLAVEDSVMLEPGSDVQMFLNTDPTAPLKGKIRQTSYEPEQNQAGSLAFRLKAKIVPGQTRPRIGLKGTAKVYGEKVSLIYYIMRRPLSALRQAVGF